MNSLQDMIVRSGARLTGADRRLLDAILADPAQAVFLSCAKLAGRAGVNQASAVRLAKKLGFEGYPDLRARLRAEFLSHSEPARRIERRLLANPGSALLAALIESEVAALENLRRHVNQEQLDQAAAVLLEAERVFIFGQGHATALADLMDRRLRRMRFETKLLIQQGRELAERAVTLASRDVVLAFALHSIPRGLRPLLIHAGRVEARTILISDLVGHTVRPTPTLLLAAPRGPEEEFQTLSVPMLVMNTLVLALARLDQERSVSALDDVAELIREFEREA